MSFLESDNMSLLFMEVNGFVHPFFWNIWDFLHGVDYGGNLNVQSFGKQSLDFRGVSCLGLCDKVLECRKVCLEFIVLPGPHLFEVVKFVPSHFSPMAWIEHRGKGLCYFVEGFVCGFYIYISQYVKPSFRKVPSSFLAHFIE